MIRLLFLGLTLVLLSACSSDEPAPPAVYVSSCMPCHGDGLGGAPVTGDAEEWERRIAKGVSKVHKNAIEGLEGGTGVMPPKGGRLDLSDNEIVALVDYMIAASR
jgi:cytochrome c5